MSVVKGPDRGYWATFRDVGPMRFTCGYCGAFVASHDGWDATGHAGEGVTAAVRICPDCGKPSYFGRDGQTPGPRVGNEVRDLPPDVAAIYNEARTSVSAGASNAAVMCCRKILMHIAVEKGAKEGLSFIEYVQFLSGKGYVPPDGKGWVDHIRERGNEANHEIVLIGRPDAESLLNFVEMLLKFVYEFPKKIPPKGK